ncbi:MAG TPA: hypothetical protein VMW94_04660 [Actinomycetes bacterium]|nr:hypothetical protein [Actinomycetes bacterium]
MTDYGTQYGPYSGGYRAPGTLLGSGGEGGDTLGAAGIGLQAAGAVSSAIGAFYSVKANQYQAKSQASALEFQQQLSWINARAAEKDAQRTLLAGQREAGRVGQQYAQLKAATLTRQAAAGIQTGVGSAGEIAASIEVAKQADQLAITRNSVHEANASRTGRVNALNRGRMAGVSAGNLRSSAGAMNPALSGATSLVGGAGRVASSWYRYDRST